MARDRLQTPKVEATLASISVFLKRVGLSATCRALASELERKGGNKLACQEGAAAASALDRLLDAALDAGCDETGKLAAPAYSGEQSGEQPQAAEVPACAAPRALTLAARLRHVECGTRGRARKDMEVAAGKLRISRCEPVALLRGHREPLVNLEILSSRAGESHAGNGGGESPLIFSGV